MRINFVVAKLRRRLLPNRHVRAIVSPQRSLHSKDETHEGIRNGVVLNERCEATQDPSGCYRPALTTHLAASQATGN